MGSACVSSFSDGVWLPEILGILHGMESGSCNFEKLGESAEKLGKCHGRCTSILNLTRFLSKKGIKMVMAMEKYTPPLPAGMYGFQKSFIFISDFFI